MLHSYSKLWSLPSSDNALANKVNKQCDNVGILGLLPTKVKHNLKQNHPE